MKNVYEILRSKEMDIARLRGEIEALRRVIPLLEDGVNPAFEPQRRLSSPAPESNRWPLELSPTDGRTPGS